MKDPRAIEGPEVVIRPVVDLRGSSRGARSLPEGPEHGVRLVAIDGDQQNVRVQAHDSLLWVSAGGSRCGHRGRCGPEGALNEGDRTFGLAQGGAQDRTPPHSRGQASRVSLTVAPRSSVSRPEFASQVRYEEGRQVPRTHGTSPQGCERAEGRDRPRAGSAVVWK